MIVEIEGVLGPERVAHFRRVLAGAPWGDGKVTAGYQSAEAKHNDQLPETCPQALELGGEIQDRLAETPLFKAAAIPRWIAPPLFNRYRRGQGFGVHIDNAIRPVASFPHMIRTDLSATLFLSDPADYDGGELVIEGVSGVQSVKLAAGSMVLYPTNTLHHVAEVTRGERLASVFWVQSLVPDEGLRAILFDMDLAIQRLRQDLPADHPAQLTLTSAYHNLLRRFSQP